jgi:hypothetical protein
VKRPNYPDQWIALFGSLADAQAAMDAAQAAGAPYPALRLGALAADELEQLVSGAAGNRAQLRMPAQGWSIVATLEPKWREQALAALRDHQPLLLGRWEAPDNRRDDTERGAIAWRHYVFETSAATDMVGDGAGTTGMTGVINSGVFADGAHAEGNPPAHATEPDDRRLEEADRPPSSDDMQPKVSQEGSRPQTKLTDQ